MAAFAKETISIGSSVMSAEPYAHVIMNSERTRRCENCFKCPAKLLKCSACKMSRYCNRICQKISWKFHKIECKFLERNSENLPDESLLLISRLLLKKHLGDADIEYVEVFGHRRQFKDLMSHEDDVRQDSRRMGEFASISRLLEELADGIFQLPDSKELFDVFGKMVINTFSICDAELQPIGAALYLGPSILNHSCQPNCVAVFSGTTLFVRAIEDIPAGREITISYIEVVDTTETRLENLSRDYYFTCSCGWCKNEDMDEKMRSTKCPTTSCSGHILQTRDEHWKPCTSCGRDNFEDKYITRCSAAVCRARDILEMTKRLKKERNAAKTFTLCRSVLSEFDDVFHRLNVYRLKLMDTLFDACIDLADWKTAAEVGVQVTQAYRIYVPKYHLYLGVHVLKLGKIQLYLQMLTESLQNLQEADEIISVTHGKHGEFYLELQQLISQCVGELQLETVGLI